jgi:hypothetical protein
MVMHLVVVGFAVPGYLLAAPADAQNSGAVATRQTVGTA